MVGVGQRGLTSCHRQHVAQRAAGLNLAAVGVDVDVPDGPLDADADAQSFPRVGVQDVHEVGVIGGQALLLLHVLKQGPRRVQTLVQVQDSSQ